jgi:adenylate kinase
VLKEEFWMNLILFGPPGAGKGTQAEILRDRFSIPTISTGNMIREAIKNGTELGKKAKSIIDGGNLLADDIVVAMVKERLSQPDCEKGFILDGFPRTIPQAQALEDMGVVIDAAVEIVLADEKIVARMSGRRTCPGCGNSYHVMYKQPKVADVCDGCGTALVIRDDDKPETVLERLRVYHEQTAPLSDFYAKKGLRRVVEGQEELADTTALMLKAVEDLA